MTDNVPSATPVQYGSFNKRVFAAAIDQTIVMIPAEPLSGWITEKFYAPIDGLQVLQEPHPWLYLYENHFFGQTLLLYCIQIACIALYTLPFWFRYSTTPGKMLFRMEILDEATGARMTRMQALRRFGGYIVSMLALSMGFIYVAFNKKRRGFHDLIAGTVVVVKPKKASL